MYPCGGDRALGPVVRLFRNNFLDEARAAKPATIQFDNAVPWLPALRDLKGAVTVLNRGHWLASSADFVKASEQGSRGE